MPSEDAAATGKLARPVITTRRRSGAVRRDTAATVLSRPQQAFIALLLVALAAQALIWG
jgi:hypothetical protein